MIVSFIKERKIKLAKKKKNNKILENHKQVGKKFIPPMIHSAGVLEEVSWVNEILPELIWFGVINDRLGVKKGTDVGSKLCKIAKKIYNKKEPRNFSYMSSYSFLDDAQQRALIKNLRKPN